MGCDIHAALEIRIDGRWQAVMRPNKWWSPESKDEPKETAGLDFDRNYSAFAILANVRNGVGFAGVDTGDGFVPISDPRGLPDDISPEARDTGCTGDHSDSWVTLAEVLAYDWTRQTTRRGWVSAETFEEWDRMKKWEPRPKGWSGGISGPRIEHVTEQEMRRRVYAVMKDARGPEWNDAITRLRALCGDLYCSISWQEPYTRAAGDLWIVHVPHMLKLGHEHGVDNVRMVMNFDS